MQILSLVKRYPLFFLALFSALLLTVGCAKDNIVLVDTATESDEADYIENTDFSQTVNIVFHADADAEVNGLTVGSKTYVFQTPSSGGTPLVVSGATTPTLKSGVTYSGGTSHFANWLFEDPTVSGGTDVSLSAYTGGNGGGPGGGGQRRRHQAQVLHQGDRLRGLGRCRV